MRQLKVRYRTMAGKNIRSTSAVVAQYAVEIPHTKKGKKEIQI